MTAAIIHAGGIVTRDQQQALAEMEAQILASIATATDAGVPQGFIVAILHAHAQIQTTRMIEVSP